MLSLPIAAATLAIVVPTLFLFATCTFSLFSQTVLVSSLPVERSQSQQLRCALGHDQLMRVWWARYATYGSNGLQLSACALAPLVASALALRRRLLRRRIASTQCIGFQRSLLSAYSLGRNSEQIADRALIFDCDGVIAESEHLHREAYNQVFQEFELGVDWSKEYYDVLQNTVGGGKPKMRYHFKSKGWPDSILGPSPQDEASKTALIDALQARKTQIYTDYIASGRACARPGILALIDAALDRPDVKTAICSASTKEAASQVLKTVLGSDRIGKFDLLILGDDVSKKKPDPLIYNVASERLGVSPGNCAVIEDSKIGLQAALGAQMRCYITFTESTVDQDFSGATKIVADATLLSLSDIFTVS